MRIVREQALFFWLPASSYAQLLTTLCLEVVSRIPVLAKAAADAVRQWEYHPARVKGEPVEIDTTVDVIYSLNE